MASSSDDEDAMDVVRGDVVASRTRTSQPKVNGGAQGNRSKERWEDIHRSWDLVTEGVDGSLAGTVEGILEANKRKRILKDTTPLQRGIIRHLVLILDLSIAMIEKDLRPTRYLLTLRVASDFITAFFEQNPISQLSLVGMRDGLALPLTSMSGNPASHIAALASLRPQEPKGVPSLQNALDMARAHLSHAPSHGTREVLIIYGALLSSDPGDIATTIDALVSDSVRVCIVGLAARVAIATEIVSRTNPTLPRDDPSTYGVALHEQHLRDLVFTHITPPPTTTSTEHSEANKPSLLLMGFPSRVTYARPSLCSCHAKLQTHAYPCSRCSSAVCSLPAQCPGCGLQLIQSTHLARSYHHLFPLRNYVEVSWLQAKDSSQSVCFACLTAFAREKGGRATKGASESGRYMCVACGRHFCIDCDVVAHEVLHNCAGCLCRGVGGD